MLEAVQGAHDHLRSTKALVVNEPVINIFAGAKPAQAVGISIALSTDYPAEQQTFYVVIQSKSPSRKPLIP